MSGVYPLLNMALSMYLGEHCRFCGRVYKTVDDLRNANVVFAGYVEPHDGTRTACKACWEASPQFVRPR